jgi:hypothetical protein
VIRKPRLCAYGSSLRGKVGRPFVWGFAVFLAIGSPRTASCSGAEQSKESRTQITILGLREFELEPLRSDQQQQSFRLPVAGGGPDILKDVTFSTVQVSVGGHLKDVGTVQLSIQPPDDKGGTGVALKAVVDLGLVDEVGTFVATIRASRPKQEPELIELKFKRLPAVLLAPESFRAEELVYLPGIWTTLVRHRLLIRETSGKSMCRMEHKEWRSDLVRVDKKPVDGQIRFELPPSIDARAQGMVTLAVDGCLPLGSSSASLSIYSRQTDPQLVIPVEIVKRLSTVWLWVTIGLSIWLGFFTRTRLENRRLLQEAQLAARVACGDLNRVIEDTQDTELRSKVQKVVGDLLYEIEKQTATPANIKTATEKAQAEVTQLLAEAAQERTKLTAIISDWRVALGLPDNQPPGLDRRVRSYANQIDAQEQLLTTGTISGIKQFFERDVVGFPGVLFNDAGTWLRKVDAVVEKIGAWPNNSLGEAIQRLRTQLDAIRSHIDEEPTFAKVRPLLADTAAARRMIDNRVLTAGRDAIVALAGRVHATIDRLLEQEPPAQDAEVENTLQSLREQLGNLNRQTRADSGDFVKFGGFAEQLADSLTIVLQGAYDLWKSENDPGAPQNLGARDFAASLDDIVQKQASALHEHLPMELGAGTTSILPAARKEDLPSGPSPLSEALPLAWTVSIATEPGPRAKSPAIFRARIHVGGDQPEPIVKLTWLIDGVAIKQSATGDCGLQYTPPTAGKIVIRVLAESEDGAKSAATTVVEVGPSLSEAISSVRRDLGRTETIQTIVFGAVIALAGFIMFRETFIGTVNDFVAAAIWGFTVDIGVARVRQLADPLLARTVPFPTAR